MHIQKVDPDMDNSIPQEEVSFIENKIREKMVEANLPRDIIDGTTVEAIHPDNWEVSVFVPYKGMKVSEIRKPVERILYDGCGIERQCCDYMGKIAERKSLEWFFRHPNVPQDVYVRLEAEIEAELGSEIGIGLPCPCGMKSKTDICFLSLKDEFYRAIDDGSKREEYRNLNQYYCDKFFSPGMKKRLVKFNRGYLSGEGNQMVFEIECINLVSEYGVEIPAHDNDGNLIVSYNQLPPNFAPVAYGIVLGKRVR